MTNSDLVPPNFKAPLAFDGSLASPASAGDRLQCPVAQPPDMAAKQMPQRQPHGMHALSKKALIRASWQPRPPSRPKFSSDGTSKVKDLGEGDIVGIGGGLVGTPAALGMARDGARALILGAADTHDQTGMGLHLCLGEAG